MKKFIFASFLTLVSSSIFAHSGLYAGIEAGPVYNALNATNNVVNDHVFKIEDRQLASRLFLGYDMNKFWGIELGYLATTNLTLNDIKQKDFKQFKIKEQIGDVSLKGSFYMGNDFFIYGKGGVAYVAMKYNQSPEGYTNKNFELLYGAGIGYNVTDHFTIDVSGTRYNGRNNSALHLVNQNWKPTLDFLALSVSYKI